MRLPKFNFGPPGALPVGCPVEAAILEGVAAQEEKHAREIEADAPGIMVDACAYLRVQIAQIRIEAAKGRKQAIVTFMEGLTK